jgi:hypothetical protein
MDSDGYDYDINSETHKNNMTIFVSNADDVTDSEWMNLSAVRKCKARQVLKYEGKPWAMIFLYSHDDAVKLWKVIDGKTSSELFDSSGDNDEPEAVLKVSWAVNKHQNSKIKKELKPLLGPRPPLGPAKDLTILETGTSTVPNQPLAPDRFVETQRPLNPKPTPPPLPPPQVLYNNLMQPMIPYAPPSLPPQQPAQQYQIQLRSTVGSESVLTLNLTEVQYHHIIHYLLSQMG